MLEDDLSQSLSKSDQLVVDRAASALETTTVFRAPCRRPAGQARAVVDPDRLAAPQAPQLGVGILEIAAVSFSDQLLPSGVEHGVVSGAAKRPLRVWSDVVALDSEADVAEEFPLHFGRLLGVQCRLVNGAEVLVSPLPMLRPSDCTGYLDASHGPSELLKMRRRVITRVTNIRHRSNIMRPWSSTIWANSPIMFPSAR